MGSGNVTETTLDVPGMPFTNMVANAQPAGKFPTGNDANEFVAQFVEDKNITRSFLDAAQLHHRVVCGRDPLANFLPLEPSAMPRNFEAGQRQTPAGSEGRRRVRHLRGPPGIAEAQIPRQIIRQWRSGRHSYPTRQRSTYTPVRQQLRYVPAARGV